VFQAAIALARHDIDIVQHAFASSQFCSPYYRIFVLGLTCFAQGFTHPLGLFINSIYFPISLYFTNSGDKRHKIQ